MQKLERVLAQGPLAAPINWHASISSHVFKRVAVLHGHHLCGYPSMASDAKPSPAKHTGALAGLAGGTLDTKPTVEKTSPDFLVVILDLDPEAWQLTSTENSSGAEQRAEAAFARLKHALYAVMVFLNAHVAMQHGNGVAIYGAVAGSAQLLYTTAPFVPQSKHSDDHSTVSSCLPFKLMDDAVFTGVRTMMSEASAEDLSGKAHKPNGMVRALSLALCHINRMSIMTRLGDAQPELDPAMADRTAKRNQLAASTFQYRILILSTTPDASAQYVPMMNCIFSAQKQGIHIDVCKLFGEDTVFLRQACHLTGGHYYSLDGLDGLLQVLTTVYLPSRTVRPMLMFPAMDDVDFRAACFCHRRNVDIGYVCSVCLSIFCGPRKECLICRSEFPPSTFQRFEDEQAVAAMLRS